MKHKGSQQHTKTFTELSAIEKERSIRAKVHNLNRDLQKFERVVGTSRGLRECAIKLLVRDSNRCVRLDKVIEAAVSGSFSL